MNPFIDVTVQPSYGERRVLISWIVASGYEDLKFYVFRSMNNGAPPWKALYDKAISGTSCEDDAFLVKNIMQLVYYQVVGVRGEDKFYSNPIGLFDKLSRSEYGAVHRIMQLEHKRMHSGRLGNGVSVYHFLPLVEGVPNSGYDPETGQKLIMNCVDNDGYGLPFKGGYSPPIKTWVEFGPAGTEVNAMREDGQGAGMLCEVQARMLAFPKPMLNHLIVHPATDNRYVVKEQVRPFLFRGIVPVAYAVVLELLQRSDSRYNVPLP